VQGNTTQNKAVQFFVGSSGLFDGSGDFISFIDTPEFDLPLEFTIEGFAYFLSLPGSGAYMGFFAHRATTGGNEKFLTLNNTSGIYSLRFYFNATTHYRDVTVSTATKYHWAIVRNASNEVRTYFNGALIGEPTTISGYAEITGLLYLGCTMPSGGTPANFMHGRLSEIRISTIDRYSGNSAILTRRK
jgi:hypothetical protein